MSKRTAEIRAMEPSLERTILKVLDFRYGRAQAIGRLALVQAVLKMGFPARERELREEIKQLRRQGWLICSVAGEDGGYYMAETRQEFEEFALMEYRGKIADMSETLSAMTRAAREQFGDGMQLELLV